TLRPCARNTDIEAVIKNRHVQGAHQSPRVVVAGFDLCHRFPLVGGFGGNDVYDTGGRVAAIERALRAAQHFHLADVEEFLFEQVIADERHVVEGDGHGGIGGHRNRLGAAAADLDVVASEIGLGE